MLTSVFVDKTQTHWLWGCWTPLSPLLVPRQTLVTMLHCCSCMGCLQANVRWLSISWILLSAPWWTSSKKLGTWGGTATLTRGKVSEWLLWTGKEAGFILCRVLLAGGGAPAVFPIILWWYDGVYVLATLGGDAGSQGGPQCLEGFGSCSPGSLLTSTLLQLVSLIAGVAGQIFLRDSCGSSWQTWPGCPASVEGFIDCEEASKRVWPERDDSMETLPPCWYCSITGCPASAIKDL